jgi:hypothetical protein
MPNIIIMMRTLSNFDGGKKIVIELRSSFDEKH